MKLLITQTRSTIGSLKAHKRTMAALGLKKIGKSVTQPDNPCIRGMIFAVKHLIKVEEIAE